MDPEVAHAELAAAVDRLHERLLPAEQTVLAAADRPGLTVQDLDDALELALAPALLAPDAGIVGGGFAADGLLGGAFGPNGPLLPNVPGHRAWWRSDTGGLARVATFDDPEDERTRDVSREDWFRVPKATRVPHLGGPYAATGVPLAGRSRFELMLSTPVLAEGELLGVAAIEVDLAAFERAVAPALIAAGEDAALVDAAGRVLVAADPVRAPGTVLPAERPRRELAWGGSGVLLAR